MNMNEEAIAAFDQDAERQFNKFEATDAVLKHAPLQPYMPDYQLDIIDIGAGSGIDAAYLHSLGHQLTAVEPTDGLRERGQKKYPQLHWVKDALPQLQTVTKQYDLIYCNCVLMFLSPEQRQASFVRFGEITKPDGIFCLILRMGPAYDGIARLDVNESELNVLQENFKLLEHIALPDPQKRPDVQFLHYIYRKTGASLP